MTNRAIQRLVLFGAFAIAGIIASQTYWLMRTWDMKDYEFNQRVNIALLNVARDMEAFSKSSLPGDELITRVASNYYVVNINGYIKPSNLEFYLKKRLEAIALNEDFEYGIYDCHSNKMFYGDYVTQGPNAEKPDARPELATYDEFTYYFGVRFPNRATHLLSSMGLTLVFTLLLLIAAAFFVYALFVILQQKRLSEQQKDFINNMTHEFKTPISTVKISTDVLLNSPAIIADERLSRYCRIIGEQNMRLNHQVEKVLQLAKIEQQNLTLQKEIILINELVEELIPSLELKINERKGTFHLDLADNLPPIDADRLHLTNILHNLLDNAIKYSRKQPDVTIKTCLKNGKILLSIADKGIGIPKEHLKRVFEKFYRVPTGNIHNVKGFGLGLFYIKNISDAHGWRVSADSKEGQSTCISIEMKPM